MLKLVCLEFSNSFQFISHFPLSPLLPFSHSHPISLSPLPVFDSSSTPPSVCPNSRSSLPAAPSLPAALRGVLGPERPCIHDTCAGKVQRGVGSTSAASRSWCQNQEWLLWLSAARRVEKPLLRLWELGNTRNGHCPFCPSLLHKGRN